jgi:hypothetical protein
VETTSNTIVQDGGPSCLLTTAMVSATITDAGSGLDVLELEVTAFGRTQTLSLQAVDSDDPDLPPAPDRFEGQVGPFRSTPPASGSAGIVATLKAVDLSGNETTSSVIIKFLGCN